MEGERQKPNPCVRRLQIIDTNCDIPTTFPKVERQPAGNVERRPNSNFSHNINTARPGIPGSKPLIINSTPKKYGQPSTSNTVGGIPPNSSIRVQRLEIKDVLQKDIKSTNSPRKIQIVDSPCKTTSSTAKGQVKVQYSGDPVELFNRMTNVPVPQTIDKKCTTNTIDRYLPKLDTKVKESPKPAIDIVECKNVFTRISVAVSLRLLTARTILINVQPNCSQLENFIKQFGTAKFMSDEKCWSIGWDDHPNFAIKVFRIPGVKVSFSNLPDFLIKMFANKKLKKSDSSNEEGDNNKNKKTYKEEAEARIEKTLLDRMFPYQKRGLEFGLSMHGKVYIADEMGLGKSIQGLAIARYYKNEWPLLIVCPAAVRYSWRDTFYNFLPSFDRSKIFLIEKNSDFVPLDGDMNNVIIISYSMLKKVMGDFNKINAKVVIFDEAHSLKSKTAARTKQATTIARSCNRIILLSGTPALSKPIELYSQLYILNSSITPKFYSFAERYCDGKRGPFGYVANGSTNPGELKTLLSTFYMIRRYKKDVMNDLPDKMRQVVYLRGDIVDEAMENLDKEKKELEVMRNKFEKNINRAGFKEKRASILEYFAKTGECKSVVAVNYIMKKYFDEDIERRKMIIFAHHKIVLDRLEMACEKKKIKYIRIDGGVTGPNRDKAIKEFQNNDTVFVAILSITAAGAGITLTAASTVIFAELHWNPGYLQQAEDRAHRIGQKNCVHVNYLVFSGTCDDYLFQTIQNKMKILGELMLNSEDFTNSKMRTEFISRQKHITDFLFHMVEEEGGDEVEEPNAKKIRIE
uniref:SWI/SNF-related matrix-associated actin-dependent regulator of chromatin subfamily A-like protein 1 n=1 Tax=Strongyloides stercoralis TaxID=6248 RepID=A0A0K0E0S3_STRER